MGSTLAMKLNDADPRDEAWDAALRGFPEATIFHAAGWARVLRATYQYRPLYKVLEPGGGAGGGLLPLTEVRSPFTGRRGVCLPFTDECVPLLAAGADPAPLRETLGELVARQGWAYLSFHGGAALFAGQPAWRHYYAHRLSLEPNAERQWARLRESNRRNIQKARREGVRIRRETSAPAMAAYYRLHCLTRQHQGVPPQPERFFRQIHEQVVRRGQGFVLLAEWAGHIIAGGVYLHFGRHAIYKFGASLLAYQHLRPNNLLMWEAIDQCREAGLATFSFGRTDPGHDGLLQFKRGWGAEESILNYYRLDRTGRFQAAPAGPAARADWTRGLLRRTPVRLLIFLGTLAYRHMG